MAGNVKRLGRIWGREGLKVPARRPKRARLWLNDSSYLRLRQKRPEHVWSYDFVEHRTHNGRKYRMSNVIHEFTRECLAPRRISIISTASLLARAGAISDQRDTTGVQFEPVAKTAAFCSPMDGIRPGVSVDHTLALREQAGTTEVVNRN
ncbi:hypothetical protein MBLL_00758 (plasmid) [Methylobacterium bullatum]|jgi:hypothetical protein|uniref:Integrase catalytic domain-containing protein n=1 Tax=Methylobacterium bullatum TaxID=570505 RepID=A0A679JP35_9HYPH|nr:hypothetical protein MBLL_00758 [Methylobacterium bullatum]